MSHEILAGTGARRIADRRVLGWRTLFHRSENIFLAGALGAMAVLPLLEIVLRTAFGFGVPGSASLVQHLTLWVGMLGGAVAAREDRLLSLSTGSALLKGRWKTAARIFSGSAAASVAALLGLASVQFVLTERAGGDVFVGRVPLFVVELVLPVGFFAVAFRLWRHASYTRAGRAVAAVLVAAVLAIVARPPLDPGHLVVPAFLALLLATVLGAPVFTALGGAALILFWGEGVPIASIPVETYRLTVSPTLPTIPLFTLAGYFFAEGGASKRLVRVFQALAGWVRGGDGFELAASDPKLGVVFYTLDIQKTETPKFQRSINCLHCHQGPATAGVPGIFIGLELLFGLVQALVFALLSMTYITLAIAEHRQHGSGDSHSGETPEQGAASAHVAA